MRFKMVHSNTKNAKSRARQSLVSYLCTTHPHVPKFWAGDLHWEVKVVQEQISLKELIGQHLLSLHLGGVRSV